MDSALTPLGRARLERWRREGAASRHVAERRAVREMQRPLLESLTAGEAGSVEIERLGVTSAWVEAAEIELGLRQLDPTAVASRMLEASGPEAPAAAFGRLAAPPFPTEDFLAELHGWANADHRPIHAPWTAAGLQWFGAAAAVDGYADEVEAFDVLARELQEVGRATDDLPLAYEIDALLQQIVDIDEAGLTPEDVAMLAAASDVEEVGQEQGRDLDRLWEKLGRLLEDVARRILGAEGHDLEIWPWRTDEAVFPFVWARLKARVGRDYATHIGLFVSVEHCNVCVDLEKDLIDAGDAGETLEQVHDFYRRSLPDALPERTPDWLQVWTDTENVLPLREFLEASYDEFMAGNNDPEHPWPKVGRILEVEDLVSAGADWVPATARLLEPLVPVYRAMLAGYPG